MFHRLSVPMIYTGKVVTQANARCIILAVKTTLMAKALRATSVVS